MIAYRTPEGWVCPCGSTHPGGAVAARWTGYPHCLECGSIHRSGNGYHMTCKQKQAHGQAVSEGNRRRVYTRRSVEQLDSIFAASIEPWDAVIGAVEMYPHTCVASQLWRKIEPNVHARCWKWIQPSKKMPSVGMSAYRWAYVRFAVAHPGTEHLDHLCGRGYRRGAALCANPLHLELVTQREHSRRPYGPHFDRMPSTAPMIMPLWERFLEDQIIRWDFDVEMLLSIKGRSA